MGVKSKCFTALEFVGTAVFEYDTPKIVHIKNKKVGFLNRVVQSRLGRGIKGGGSFLGCIYAARRSVGGGGLSLPKELCKGWGIIIQKGYQKTGPVAGTVTTKLKGAYHYTGEFGDYSENCAGANGDINRTFDVGDYVIPPEEPDSFFIMTNLWETCGQTQGTCAESPSVYGSNCTVDPDNVDAMNNSACLKDGRPKVFEAGNGPTTGRCLNSSESGSGQCEIRAWCNVEEEDDEITERGPKINASEFTVLVKASIEFPTVKPGLRKRNIKNTADSLFLKTCRFNESTSDTLYCPIFSLQQIIDMIEPKGTHNFTELSIKGGVVGLEIHWDCDHLERNLDHCHPKYIAKRYDNPEAKISAGFNFRHARHYYEEGVEKRILTKAYGILFKIEIHGTGGKFDFFTLVLKIGSMIALLGIATIVSDILVLYIFKGRDYYRGKKYQHVADPATRDYEIVDHKDADERTSINSDKA